MLILSIGNSYNTLLKISLISYKDKLAQSVGITGQLYFSSKEFAKSLE